MRRCAGPSFTGEVLDSLREDQQMIGALTNAVRALVPLRSFFCSSYCTAQRVIDFYRRSAYAARKSVAFYPATFAYRNIRRITGTASAIPGYYDGADVDVKIPGYPSGPGAGGTACGGSELPAPLCQRATPISSESLIAFSLKRLPDKE